MDLWEMGGGWTWIYKRNVFTVCVDRWRFIYGGVWLLGMKKSFQTVELKAWERTEGGGVYLSDSEASVTMSHT